MCVCVCVCVCLDSTDLETIEALSNEVLAMDMPATAAQLEELSSDISERVTSLTGVEDILAQSHDDITQARALLQDAKTARYTHTHTQAHTDETHTLTQSQYLSHKMISNDQ